MLFSLSRIYYTRTTNMRKHSLAERDKLFAKKTVCHLPTQTKSWFPLVRIPQHNTPKLHGHNLISSKYDVLWGIYTTFILFYSKSNMFNKFKTVSDSECEVSKMGHLPPRARGHKVGIVQNISSEKNYSPANQRLLMCVWCKAAICDDHPGTRRSRFELCLMPANESLAELAALLVVVAQCLLHLEGTARLSCPPACRALPCRYSMNAVVHSTAVCAAIAELL